MWSVLKFPWRPSRVYSSSKSSETIFCVPKGLLSLTRGQINWCQKKINMGCVDRAIGQLEKSIEISNNSLLSEQAYLLKPRVLWILRRDGALSSFWFVLSDSMYLICSSFSVWYSVHRVIAVLWMSNSILFSAIIRFNNKEILCIPFNVYFKNHQTCHRLTKNMKFPGLKCLNIYTSILIISSRSLIKHDSRCVKTYSMMKYSPKCFT